MICKGTNKIRENHILGLFFNYMERFDILPLLIKSCIIHNFLLKYLSISQKMSNFAPVFEET